MYYIQILIIIIKIFIIIIYLQFIYKNIVTTGLFNVIIS